MATIGTTIMNATKKLLSPPATSTYDSYKSSPPAGVATPNFATPAKVSTPTTIPQPTTAPKATPKYNEEAQTQYIPKGGDALNEILYSKKQYDAGAANQSADQKAWASNNAQQYYSQLDPTESAAVKNMSTQELIDYINGKGGKNGVTATPAFAPAATSSGSLPVFTAPTDAPQVTPYDPAIPVMDEAAIRKYAEDQTNRKLSDARLTADQAIANAKLTSQQQSDALKSNYDKMYQTINEDRSTEDVQNQRRLSPFSGRSDYALGMIEQGRARTDRENQDTLQTNQSNIAAQAAQLEQQINDKYTALANAAPDEREALFQSIKNDERNYDLMVHGQLTQDAITNSQLGNTAFNQSLQEFMTNYQVDQDKIRNDAEYGGTYNGNQSLQGRAQTLAEKNANLDSALQYSNMSGQILSPQSDWSGYVRQINSGKDANGNALTPTMSNTQLMAQLTGTLPNGQKTTQQQQQELQNLWTQADYTGTIPNQLADLYGIPRGTQTQAAKQWAASYQLQQDQFQSGVDQDLYKLLNGGGQSSAGLSASDIVKTINSSPLLQQKTDPSTGQKVPVNYSDPSIRNQLEAMIITQTQDPVVAVQLYNYYGIPIPSQLQQEYQQALSGKTVQ